MNSFAPDEPPLAPIQRRLRAVTRLLGTLTRLLVGENTHGTDEFQLRCTVFTLASGFLTTVFFGLMMGLSGEYRQCFNLFAAAMLYVACAGLLRRTRRVDWTLNAIAAVSWLCIIGQMCEQGGSLAPTK